MTHLIQAALAEVKRQRELAVKVTPGKWTQKSCIVLRNSEGVLACAEPDDAAFTADARNHAEATCELLEALLTFYKSVSAGVRLRTRSEHTVDRALAAFVPTERTSE